jgi:hypothetical protein
MSRVAFSLLLLLAARQDAGLPSGWRQVQDVTVPKAGPLKIELPVETLDSARSRLEDLRLLDEGGREISWTAERPRQEARAAARAARFETALGKNTTVLTIETGFPEALERMSIETPSEGFIKPVRLEGSSDKTKWTILKDAEPLFVGPGRARKVHVDLAPAVWPYLRLTLDDQKSGALPITGVVLLPAAPPAAPAEPWPVEIIERLEEPGRTHLRIRFPGRHVTLAEIGIDTPEPLFTRRLTLSSRTYTDGRVSEHLLAEGSVYRMALDGRAPVSKLSLEPDVQLPERELLLTIENGDSPPLQVGALRARRRPVRLAFASPKPGTLRLLTGNPDCPAPRYDLAALPGLGRELPVEPAATVSALRENPSYRAPEALPGLGGPGAAIDVSPWGFRKPVKLGSGAIHQLELDLDVLSRAARGMEDLRLARDGKQVPYVVETTSLSRPLSLQLVPEPDPKRPTLSRWSIVLPRKRLPVSRLTFTARETVFQREARLSEDVPDERGVEQHLSRASASWVRRPGAAAGTLDLTLHQEPHGDRLLLEVENGDNPALTLGEAKAWVPLTRVLFKAPAGPDLHLYYGNRQARAPEYDLALAAPQLLAASRLEASLGTEETLAAAPHQVEGTSGTGSWIFWGVLAVVVAGLLFVIARMLPAAPPAQ